MEMTDNKLPLLSVDLYVQRMKSNRRRRRRMLIYVYIEREKLDCSIIEFN